MCNATTNMTVGRPLVLLSVFALPLLIGNVFQQAYNLADSMIVGRLLGANALAAVGATGSVSFLFFSVFNGISGGCSIVTAQLFGARKDRDVRLAIVNSAGFMLLTSVMTGLVAFLMVPTVLGWMGTPQEVMPDAVIYMRMTTASVPLVAVYNFSSSMQRALGDSRTPLIFLIFSCILNVGLDLLFVGGFHLGVFGAALATMLSQLVAGIGSLRYAFRRNPYFHVSRRDMVCDWKIINNSVTLGLPLALQWGLIAVSMSALQSVANSFGPVAMAAYTATSRLEQLVQQPFSSLSMALSTYSGQNIGAGRKDRIRAGFVDGLLVSLVMAGCMMVLMRFFGNRLVGLFVHETEVIDIGGQALRITSLFYAFLGLIYVCRGVLNGIGDAYFAFINGFVEVAARIGLPLLLMQYTETDVFCIWIIAGLSWLISGLSCLMRYIAWNKKTSAGNKVSNITSS